FAARMVKSPVGPQPKTATFLFSTSASDAAWTAFPSGSRIDATSAGVPGAFFQAQIAGTERYSANVPCRWTPRIWSRSQICIRSSRHCAHSPHGRWLSTETQSPTLKLATSRPTSTTSPATSWPRTRGGRTVVFAQSFHDQMWTSVPQIEVARTRRSRSFGPQRGRSTSAITAPGAGAGFSRAFMISPLSETDFDIIYIQFLIMEYKSTILENPGWDAPRSRR